MAPGELPRGVAVEKTPVGNDEGRGGKRRSGRRRMRPPSAMAEREGEKGTNGGGVKRPAGGEEARFPGISARVLSQDARSRSLFRTWCSFSSSSSRLQLLVRRISRTLTLPRPWRCFGVNFANASVARVAERCNKARRN